MSSNDGTKKDFSIQSVINDFGDVNDGDTEGDKSDEEIVLDQIAVTSVTFDGTEESNVDDGFVQDQKATKRSVVFIPADNVDKHSPKTSLTNKSVHFNDISTTETEKTTKKEILHPILKSVPFDEDGGVDNAVQALERDSPVIDKISPDENDLQSEENEISVETDDDSEHSEECASKSELDEHVERLRSTGKIEKVALIDINGRILIRSIGMDINSEDAETVLHVLGSSHKSLAKIRIGKQDFTCFKNSTDSFIGRAENDFLHARSCLDFIVVCISDPNSPGSCIYEVSRFVKRCYRTSTFSNSELSALV